ncbi:MAG TPA: hypothetical protein VNZ26_25935, partial [Vicinamibacterales bacterium]|nr:hypothetical protein [Vicinamibacterales bacterium]
MGFYLRLARIGLVVALAVGLSGWGFERIRFGASDQSALARVDRELRQRLDLSARTLATIADRVAGERDRIRVAPRDPAAAKRLFDVADEALAGQDTTRAGITIYNSDGTPLAWAGRVSDQPLERIVGPPALFVETSRFGPRLVRIEPVIDPTERVHPLVHPAVVVEQGLGTETTPGVGDTFTIPTSIVPVTLRAQTSDAPGLATHDPYTLIVPVGSDGLLIEAYVSPSDLHDARASWQRAIWAAVVLIGGLVILLGVGPLLERRRRIHQTPTFLMTTFGIAAIVF